MMQILECVTFHHSIYWLTIFQLHLGVGIINSKIFNTKWLESLFKKSLNEVLKILIFGYFDFFFFFFLKIKTKLILMYKKWKHHDKHMKKKKRLEGCYRFFITQLNIHPFWKDKVFSLSGVFLGKLLFRNKFL